MTTCSDCEVERRQPQIPLIFQVTEWQFAGRSCGNPPFRCEP